MLISLTIHFFIIAISSYCFLTACGGILHGKGVIQSPYYPNPYPHDRSCEWVITQSEGYIVTLKLISFDTEKVVNCSHDYIEVRELYLLLNNLCLISKYHFSTFLKAIVRYFHFAICTNWTWHWVTFGSQIYCRKDFMWVLPYLLCKEKANICCCWKCEIKTKNAENRQALKFRAGVGHLVLQTYSTI